MIDSASASPEAAGHNQPLLIKGKGKRHVESASGFVDQNHNRSQQSVTSESYSKVQNNSPLMTHPASISYVDCFTDYDPDETGVELIRDRYKDTAKYAIWPRCTMTKDQAGVYGRGAVCDDFRPSVSYSPSGTDGHVKLFVNQNKTSPISPDLSKSGSSKLELPTFCEEEEEEAVVQITRL